jgi:thiamine pyrophosphate-dependent acetolactate synthase large subunit-like protein
VLTVAGPAAAASWQEPPADAVERLSSASRICVLAGPGVVDAGAVPGLHAIATAGSLGVLNTWGAKGVFDWRSRHHLATAGLQVRDFELAGFDGVDLILATGVDADEAPAELWQRAPVLTVAPPALSLLAERWHRPPAPIAVPPLRSGLAAVTQAGWEHDDAPLLPTRVTLNYARCLGDGGLVAADPGVAGYWVARTFSTTELRSVQVPAGGADAGFAVACAIVSKLRRPLRPALAVIDGPPAPVVRELLDVAAGLGVAVAVEAWADDGEQLDAAAHLARLDTLLRSPQTTVASLATDSAQLDDMIAVAGPIAAWRGPS